MVYVFRVTMEPIVVHVLLNILELIVTPLYVIISFSMNNNQLSILFFLAICASAPCLNGGTCYALNSNTVAYCQCPAGYTGSRCGMCFSFGVL